MPKMTRWAGTLALGVRVLSPSPLNFLICTKHQYNSKVSGFPQQHSNWAAYNWAGVEEANHSLNKTTNPTAVSHPQVCHFFPTFPAQARSPTTRLIVALLFQKITKEASTPSPTCLGHCYTPQNFLHSHAFLSPHKSILPPPEMWLLTVAHLWALRERLKGRVPSQKGQHSRLFAPAQP